MSKESECWLRRRVGAGNCNRCQNGGIMRSTHHPCGLVVISIQFPNLAAIFSQDFSSANSVWFSISYP